jgi:hypothetical protein
MTRQKKSDQPVNADSPGMLSAACRSAQSSMAKQLPVNAEHFALP